MVPSVEFPENLPVSGRREEIAKLIEKHQVVVLAGETGRVRPLSYRKSAWVGARCQRHDWPHPATADCGAHRG